MNTPERVKRALAKYNINDEKINSKVRSAGGGASIELFSAYVDIEVKFSPVSPFPEKGSNSICFF